jgi:DedD protein
MADHEYREIQLSGKQIVFLFMSLVVVAVVIFLLGVSVGRGVRGPESAVAAQGAAPGDTVAMVTPPPATQTGPGDLQYHSMLQGQQPGAGGANPAPAQPPAPPPSTDPVPTDPPPPPPANPPEAGRAAAPPPQKTAAAPPTRSGGTGARSGEPAPTPVAKSGGWMVQVGAFQSRGNAENLVAQLKRRGHAATIIRNPAAPNAPHNVRVGPFADKAAADKAAAVLAREQGVGTPSVIR